LELTIMAASAWLVFFLIVVVQSLLIS